MVLKSPFETLTVNLTITRCIHYGNFTRYFDTKVLTDDITLLGIKNTQPLRLKFKKIYSGMFMVGMHIARKVAFVLHTQRPWVRNSVPIIFSKEI